MYNGHGGDIYRNRIAHDFSVNINPYGMPESVRKALYQAAEHAETYPDITCEALKKALAEYEQTNEKWLLCGNGASELFCAIVHGLRPHRILIPVPSFSGYERASEAEGAEVIFYEMKEAEQFSLTDNLFAQLDDRIDMLWLANPNNPVGNTMPAHFLKKIAEICKKNKTTLVIDECFLPFTDEKSFAETYDIADYPNIIVVKAFTKTFAMAGVRLGYLIASDEKMRERIEKNLAEWNVSAFAQAAGIAAAQEKEYVAQSRRNIWAQREKCREELENAGIKVFPSQSNFLLLKTELPIYEALLKKHILIRSCANYRGLSEQFYRIAIRSEEENAILLDAIREVKEGARHGRN